MELVKNTHHVKRTIFEKRCNSKLKEDNGSQINCIQYTVFFT